MTDYVSASSSATTMWTGEGYSAFASASATDTELKISYIDTDNVVQYKYTITSTRVHESHDYISTDEPTLSPTEKAEKIPDKLVQAQTMDVSQHAVFVSGGLAALAFMLIAGAFAYEMKGRRRRRKNRKLASLLMSSMSTPMQERAASDTVNENISTPFTQNERSDTVLRSGTSFSPRGLPTQSKYYDIGPKRGLISLPAHINLIPYGEMTTARMMGPSVYTRQRAEGHKEYSPQRCEEGTITASENFGSTESRSLDGKYFESVPSSPAENYKATRTFL